MNEIIYNANLKLQHYIESESYKGYDPYDFLKSPLFQFPFFKSNKIVRFFTQQLGKRFPLNLRPLFFVTKGYNPVTLGLCIQAYAYLYEDEQKENEKEKLYQNIEFLIDELITLQATGFSGACWGYDFDWEARTVAIPGYKPTIVATGIIVNALYNCYKITGSIKARDLVIDSSKFVLHDLNRTENDSLCFSYSPFDKQKVLNANMKGVRILSQVYALTGQQEFLEIATRAVNYVIKKQNSNGSWGYSEFKKIG